MPPKRVKKVMTMPINVIFGHLQVRVFLHYLSAHNLAVERDRACPCPPPRPPLALNAKGISSAMQSL